MEFGSDPGKKGAENREKMAKASRRALKKGDSSVYQNSVNSITKGGGDKEALADFNKKFEGEIEEDSDAEELSGDFNTQPANNLATEGRQQFKVTESQLKAIIRESVMRILQEEYTGDEPYVPNKYPGQMPKFSSKQQYRQWCNNEAPSDFFDWKDDRKFQRTGIQPGQSGLAPQAMRDRRDGKMSWNNNKAYNRFQTLKRQNGVQ
jgi:hypothetical protein